MRTVIVIFRVQTAMSKLIVFLFIALMGGALQHLEDIRAALNPLPPLAPGSYKVVLYSTTWCGYCAKTRTYFADNHIEYVDVDVEKTEAGKAAYQQLGANGVPIVVVNEDKIIRGYAPAEIAGALTTAN